MQLFEHELNPKHFGRRGGAAGLGGSRGRPPGDSLYALDMPPDLPGGLRSLRDKHDTDDE
ncbi:hypothetical protein ACWGSU_20795 [Streptomyces koyangensis]|uniref:hypothetical protein n=1 Tax=Streptomyces longispororuber TaxID=68230 RepID=UPI0037024E01